MKRNRRDKGSIVRLLLQNHLFFTLSIAISALVIFYGASAHIKSLDRYLNSPLSEQDAHLFASESYHDILPKHALMRGTVFGIYDAKGQLLYISHTRQKSLLPTPEELDCVPSLGSNQYVSASQHEDEQGSPLFLLLRTTFLPDEKERDEYLLLDANYAVVDGLWEGSKAQYTPREYAFITNSFSSEYSAYRYEFQTEKGETRKAAVLLPLVTDVIADHAYRIQHRATMIFFFTYLILAFLFVMWLNRTVRKPLLIFSQMIEDFSLEKPLTSHYIGQREFVRIFDSFSKMSEKLTDSQKRKDALEAERQVLLANISHDLKTPITVIQGYAKAICDDLVPESEKKRYDQIIYQKSCTLSDLINTFAEYSRLEHPEFKLDTLCRDLYETMREYLVAKYDEIGIGGYLLDINIPDEQRCLCHIDYTQLARVFDNLIANTIKYNPPGTTLFFSVEHEADEAIIHYADDGTGISAELSQTLFEPFVVGQKARTTGQGSGLGLAITKKIVVAHHGSIRVVLPPRSGKGLEFEVRLPVTPRQSW